MRIPLLALFVHDWQTLQEGEAGTPALDSAGSAQVSTEGLQLPSTPGPGPAARACAVAEPALLHAPPRALPLLPTLLSMKDNYLFLKEVKNLVEKPTAS